MNSATVDLLGYSKEELIGKSVLELDYPTEQNREKVMRLLQRAQGGEQFEGEEFQMLRKDRSIIWLNVTVRLIRNEEGQIVEIRGVVQNISERKNREEELADKQRRLQLMNSILSQINAGMTVEAIIGLAILELSVLFPAYRVTYSTIMSNGELEVKHSYEPQGMRVLKGEKANLNRAPEYLMKLRTHQSVCISDITNDPLVSTVANVMLSRQTRAICDVPLVHSGKLQGLLCLDASEPHDWTEFEKSILREVAELVALRIHNAQGEKDRRDAEVALETNRQRLSMALEATGSGTWDWDLQTGHVVSEDAWFRTLGYEPHQTTPHVRFWKTLVHPDDMRHVRDALKRHFSGETETYECVNRLRKSNGEWRWSLDRGRIIQWSAEGKALRMVGTNTDITESRVLQARLEESEARFEKYFASGLVGMAITSLDKQWIEVNERMCDILGFTRDELIEKTWEEITHSDDLTADEAKFSQLLSREIESYSMEKRFVRKDGQMVHANMYINAVRNNAGTVEYVMAMVEDISARKQTEEKLKEAQGALQGQYEELEQEVQRRSIRIQELEQRRMQVEKLAALAQVAAGVAHEINNPLASISQAMVLVKDALDPAHPDFEYIGRIDECVNRMARIVRHMYDLYRPHQSTMSQQNVVPIVSTAIDIMQSVADERQVYIEKALPIHEIMVSCQSSELVQVICNLLQNAYDVSDPGQRIIVNITTQENSASISVADQGAGIASDVKAHIFEPFFTTKGSRGRAGLGLGLSVSRSLIQSMGGSLDFTSNSKRGSIFTISLPVIIGKERGNSDAIRRYHSLS